VRWFDPAYQNCAWAQGQAPIQYNRGFKDSLAGSAQPLPVEAVTRFSHAVEIAPGALEQCRGFHLQIKSASAAVAVWIKGTPVPPPRAVELLAQLATQIPCRPAPGKAYPGNRRSGASPCLPWVRN
jgi:hypothetical protein